MHNHFSDNLNLKKLILEKRPRVIVECGAGKGELTALIASLLDVYDFEFYVISDSRVDGLDSRIQWRIGLSYEELETFPPESIGLCVIDTDHNYWTLMKELSALLGRVENGGFVAMHDVETFYHDTGMALSYWDGKPYPQFEVEQYSHYGSLGDALIEFLQMQKIYFKMYSWNHESNGAALIQKSFQPMFAIVTPGPNAVFSKKETSNEPVLQAS